ncbi:MAG: molecular chaperone DnaJ [Clostridia bacterium]|nr:molecular chaperone DnaJ [Oscillospiraceae bacterium]MBQ6701974.1 molecular chaperone DnaJ [Clostridia bacterium]
MADNKRDYYEVLGIDKNADEQTIKKAYRKMVKEHHPDVNPDDPKAEEKFKEINEAYEVLRDSEKRARYDQYGHAGMDPNMGGGFGGFDFGGGFGGFDFGDIFGNIFGGGGHSSSARRNMPQQGEDLRAHVVVSFEEAAFGCKKEISYNRIEVCDECNGSGAKKGTSAETCKACGGTGQVRVTQRTPFGMVQTSKTCEACGGKGKTIKNPCTNCRGTGYVRVKKTLEVTVPAGIDDGQRIVLQKQGNAGKNGGDYGDLYVTVSVRPHTVFERDGYDIYCDVPITFVEAALGAEIDIPTLDGKVKYTIPEGTQTDTRFTLRGKGIQNIRSKNSKGDLIFKVVVEVPKGLTANQKSALKNFAEVCGNSNYTKKESFLKKIFGKDKQ